MLSLKKSEYANTFQIEVTLSPNIRALDDYDFSKIVSTNHLNFSSIEFNYDGQTGNLQMTISFTGNLEGQSSSVFLTPPSHLSVFAPTPSSSLPFML